MFDIIPGPILNSFPPPRRRYPDHPLSQYRVVSPIIRQWLPPSTSSHILVAHAIRRSRHLLCLLLHQYPHLRNPHPHRRRSHWHSHQSPPPTRHHHYHRNCVPPHELILSYLRLRLIDQKLVFESEYNHNFRNSLPHLRQQCQQTQIFSRRDVVVRSGCYYHPYLDDVTAIPWVRRVTMTMVLMTMMVSYFVFLLAYLITISPTHVP
mmetsp:Transcript_36014/g.39018  ORF Transcript_36014/g.39018 Transcript_36014/m.39018 type:complete len:207 (-) Transcript_36014:470-1090(-)